MAVRLVAGRRQASHQFPARYGPANGWSQAAAIAAAVRRASAMIVSIGLTPEAVGKALASPIHTPLVSWSWPQGSATLVAGAPPSLQLPIWWAVKIAYSRGASEC